MVLDRISERVVCGDGWRYVDVLVRSNARDHLRYAECDHSGRLLKRKHQEERFGRIEHEIVVLLLSVVRLLPYVEGVARPRLYAMFEFNDGGLN